MADISKIKALNNTTYNIKDAVARDKLGHIFFGTCSTASNTAEKSVTCADFATDNLVNGAILFVTFTETNTAAVDTLKLNVNDTGAFDIKQYVNGRLVHVMNADYLTDNYTLMFYLYKTSSSTYWVIASINTDNNNNIKYIASRSIYRYNFVFHTNDTTVTILTSNNAVTDTTKTMLTAVSINPFSPVYYYAYSSYTAKDSPVPRLYTTYNLIDARYSFNVTTTSFTANMPVYLRLTPQSDGRARLSSATSFDEATTNAHLTQHLPTSNDNYWYLFLGWAYDGYRINMWPYHPVYAHDGTNVYIVTSKRYDDAVKKVDGIEAGAEVNVIESIKLADASSALSVSSKTVTIPKMTAASSSAAGTNGLVPGAAKGAQGKFLRGDATWQTVITSIPGMGAASSSTAGTAGSVPAPAAGKESSFLRGDATWATPTDTKNTAGSTDSSKKLYLIGAESQAANPQTYSHDTAYVGTDGCLYSGGTKVLTAHQSISGKKNTQTAVTDPTADGSSVTFIDTISQNTQGVITPTKKTVSTMGAASSSTAGTAGLVPAPAKGAQAKFLRADATWQTVLTAHQDISGKKNIQTAVTDPTADGDSFSFIDTISQNTQGVITPTKKTVPTMGPASDSSAGTAGLVPAPEAGAQTKFLRADGTWVTPTNTRNSAGSSNSSAKLFLIGAKTQSSYATTYSQDTAYVGTDGCLYSGGTKVLTAHQDISGKADKSATVSTVTYDTTNKKITKTINGTTSDVVTVATLKTDMDLGSTYKTKQTAVSDPTESGTSATFIATISQDAQGKITATKKTVRTMGAASSSSAGTTGLVPAPGSGSHTKFLCGNATWQGVPYLGIGYAECDTAAATAAKVGTMDGYVFNAHGLVYVRFLNNVPANATLNINSTGAKNITYRDEYHNYSSNIRSGIIHAGDIALFSTYGNQYNLLSINRSAVVSNALYIHSNTRSTSTCDFAIVVDDDRNLRVIDRSLMNWESVIAACADGTYKTKYRIGDEVMLDLVDNSDPDLPALMESLTMVCVAMDTDELAEDSSSTAHMTWMAKEILMTKYKYNNAAASGTTPNTGVYGAYTFTDIRVFVESYKDFMPTNLQNAILQVNKLHRSKYDSDAIMNYNTWCYVWIPSIKELGIDYGSETGVTYEYFNSNVMRKAYYPEDNASAIGSSTATAQIYYTRTLAATTICTINENGVKATTSPTTARGIRIGFCT